jgi:DnaK suppressor protein
MEAASVHGNTELGRLEEERQLTLEKITHLRSELRSMAEPSADEADVDAYEREKTLALIQTLERKLESLDHARLTALDGKYGICESCGARIDPARLEILPHTTLCLRCKRAVELRHKRARGTL